MGGSSSGTLFSWVAWTGCCEVGPLRGRAVCCEVGFPDRGGLRLARKKSLPSTTWRVSGAWCLAVDQPGAFRALGVWLSTNLARFGRWRLKARSCRNSKNRDVHLTWGLRRETWVTDQILSKVRLFPDVKRRKSANLARSQTSSVLSQPSCVYLVMRTSFPDLT